MSFVFTDARGHLMMNRLRVLLFAALACFAQASAAAGPDGWIVALGWSPEFCKAHPGSKEQQCTEENYFLLHGLAPVFRGNAPGCSSGRLPEELADQARLDVPNRARVKYIWLNEGSCSRLEPREYVVQLARAARRFAVPLEYREAVGANLDLTQEDLKSAFIRANRDLKPDSLLMQCSRGFLTEVHICVDTAFQPQSCGEGQSGSCKEKIRVRGIPANRLREAEDN
ncbi:MAG: hypothetical protein ACT4PZ_17320 [Panacagrimonas sp.]